MTQAERDMANGGDKIGAIRLVRARTGMGLLESRNLVEAGR
jgi:ribosomal protein L7/L12